MQKFNNQSFLRSSTERLFVIKIPITFSSSELVRDGAFPLFLKVFVAKSFIVFPITGTGKLIWKYGYFVPQ